MRELRVSKGSVENGLELEVTIKGNGNDLKKQAINFLISDMDLKHDFNEDRSLFDKFVEDLLLQAADVVGYEHYYWNEIPREEATYNEYDELIVSDKVKIELLEDIISDMKKRLSR